MELHGEEIKITHDKGRIVSTRIRPLLASFLFHSPYFFTYIWLFAKVISERKVSFN